MLELYSAGVKQKHVFKKISSAKCLCFIADETEHQRGEWLAQGHTERRVRHSSKPGLWAAAKALGVLLSECFASGLHPISGKSVFLVDFCLVGTSQLRISNSIHLGLKAHSWLDSLRHCWIQKYLKNASRHKMAENIWAESKLRFNWKKWYLKQTLSEQEESWKAGCKNGRKARLCLWHPVTENK